MNIIILSYRVSFPREQIIFLYMTLLKLASSSEEKVADFTEQCSRRVSSVVGGYWNPWTHSLTDLLFLYSVLHCDQSLCPLSIVHRKAVLNKIECPCQ